MLDIKTIRQNIDLVKTALKNRGAEVDLNVLIDLDARRRALIQEAEDLKAKRNQFSQLMAKGKSEGIDIDARKNEMREISERIKAIDGELKEAEDAVTSFVLEIPNIPHESVPVGHSPEDNPVVRTWGEKPAFSFAPKEHWDIGEGLGILDFKRAAKITGTRFCVNWGAGAASNGPSSPSCSPATPGSTAAPRSTRPSW